MARPCQSLLQVHRIQHVLTGFLPPLPIELDLFCVILSFYVFVGA